MMAETAFPKVPSNQSLAEGSTCQSPHASTSMMALYRTMHVMTYAVRLIECPSTMEASRSPTASRLIALASFSLIAWIIIEGLT